MAVCDGCITEGEAFHGPHLHCPACDAVMLDHQWAQCGRCSTDLHLVIEARDVTDA